MGEPDGADPKSGRPDVGTLATFASSESGKLFAFVERYYGRDPSAWLEPIDDVLAYNLRVVFALDEIHRPNEAGDDGVDETTRSHRDLADRARRGAAAIRRAMTNG